MNNSVTNEKETFWFLLRTIQYFYLLLSTVKVELLQIMAINNLTL